MHRTVSILARTAVTAVAAVALLLSGAQAASAAPATGFNASEISAIVKATPGAKQVSANEIKLAPGASLFKEAKGSANAALAPRTCTYQYLCFWLDAHYEGGLRLELYSCGYHNMSWYGWDNAVSSLVNNQSSGTISHFYNYTNTTGYIGQQHAYGYRDNLALDTASSGGNWDNKIPGSSSADADAMPDALAPRGGVRASATGQVKATNHEDAGFTLSRFDGPFAAGPGVRGSAHEAVQLGETPVALPVPWKPNSTDCPAATRPL